MPRGISLQGGLNTGRERTNKLLRGRFSAAVVQRAGDGERRGDRGRRHRAEEQRLLRRGGRRSRARSSSSASIRCRGWGLQTRRRIRNLPGAQISASYVASNALIAPSLRPQPVGGRERPPSPVDLIAPGTLYGARAQRARRQHQEARQVRIDAGRDQHGRLQHPEPKRRAQHQHALRPAVAAADEYPDRPAG